MRENRKIKCRAKGKSKCYGWVTGGYFYQDDDRNNPFHTSPKQINHYICTYFSGDWNMGTWEQVQVHPETIQQFTGLITDDGVEIYEGDIIRIHSVSYDEDGTQTISLDYKEGVVVFENGGFKLEGGEYLHELISCHNHIVVVGNSLTMLKLQTAIDYRARQLCDNFEVNRLDLYPEFIDVAFITFAHEAAQIIMDSYACYYSPIVNGIIIDFIYNGVYYQLLKHNLDETPEYILCLINKNDFTTNHFSELIRTTDFNLVKDTLTNKK